MLKRILFFLIPFIIVNNVFAQQQVNSDKPPYLQVPYIPPFKLLLTNNEKYSKNDLPKKTNIVIIYLNTDCGHCKDLVKQIVDSFSLVRKTFFVLSSYNKIDEISAFENSFNLKQFDKLVIGRDEKYFIPSFYKLTSTPFVAVYNKKGKLIKAYQNGFSISELLKLI